METNFKKEKKIRIGSTIVVDIIYFVLLVITFNIYESIEKLYRYHNYDLFIGLSMICLFVGSFFMYKNKIAVTIEHIFMPAPPLWQETSKAYRIVFYIWHSVFNAIAIGLIISLIVIA